jgi:WD40 repeat protein
MQLKKLLLTVTFLSAIISTVYSHTSAKTALEGNQVSITQDVQISGHTPSIRDAFVSTDGQYVLSLDNYNYTSYWSLGDGQRLRYQYLDFEDYSARAMAAIPGGRHFVTVDKRYDSGINRVAFGLRQYRQNDGSMVRSFAGDWGELAVTAADWYAAEISPDWEYVAAAGLIEVETLGRRVSVVVMHRTTGEVVFMNTDDVGLARSVAISPDNQLVAVGGKWFDSATGFVRVWEIATGNLLHTFTHARDVNTVTFAPEGRILVYGGSDLPRSDQPDTVRVRNLNSGELLHSLPHEEAFTRVAKVTPDGQFILTGGKNDINVWRMSDGSLVNNFPEVHSASLQSISVGLDGNIIVSASADGTIKVTEVQTGQNLQEIGIGMLKGAVITSGGRYVVSAGGDGALRKWNRYTGELLQKSLEKHTAPVSSLTLKGNTLTTSGSGSRAAVRTWRGHNIRPVMEYLTDPLTRLNGAVEAFNGTDRYFVAATRGYGIKVWDGASGDLLHTLDEGAVVQSIAVTMDGLTAISGGTGGSLKYWRLSDGALLHEESAGHTSKVMTLATTNDGEFVISGSMDGLIKVWRLSDYGLAKTFTLPDMPTDPWMFGVRALAISPDGAFLACGRHGDLSSVEIWQINNSTFVTSVTGHREPIRSIAFDDVGSTIVTAGEDDEIWTWVVDPPMGIAPPTALSMGSSAGLPAQVVVRGTFLAATACTLSVNVDPTKLVPADPFIVSDVYNTQPEAASSFIVDGSDIQIILSGSRPVSLLNGFVVKFAFDVADGAEPGSEVPITWNAAGTSIGGSTPEYFVNTGYTIPIPRDTRISSISPASTPAGVPAELVIRGANFTGTTSVILTDGSETSVNTFFVVNDGLIRAILPATLEAGTYGVRIVSPLGIVESSNALSVTAASSDTQPPNAIADVAITDVTTTSLLVTWSAPADTLAGGSVDTNPVAGYDLRVTTAAIDSSTFINLPRVPLPSPQSPGATESAWVGPLESGRVYFVAMVSTDDAGNRSALSNVAYGITLEDNEAPEVLTQVVTAISDVQLTVIIETDEPVRGVMKVFEAFGGTADTTEVAVDDLVFTHRLTATGLTPATVYGYVVELFDARENSTLTSVRPVTTLAFPDETTPSFAVPVFMGERADNSVTLGWTANEPVTSTVVYGVTEAYSDSIIVTDAALAHVVKIEGLEPLTDYHIRVKLFDLAGNGPVESDDVLLRTLRDPDSFPPQFVAAPAVIASDSTSVTIAWETDASTTGKVEYGTDENLGLAKSVSDVSTSHSVVLTKLIPGTPYYYHVQAINDDESVTTSNDRTFLTRSGADLNPPVVLESPVAIVGMHEARIRFRTDEPSMSLLLLYEQAQGTLSRVIPPALEFTTKHEVYIDNLEAGKTYYYHLTPFDMARNEPILRLRSFRTTDAPDETPPVLVAGPSPAYRSDERVVIRWRTDEVSTGELWYQASGDSVAISVVDPSLDWSHQVALTNLASGSQYDFAVVLRDMDGNETIYPDGSTVVTTGGKTARLTTGRSTAFTTAATPDESSPVILDGPIVVGKSSQTLSVEWLTNEMGTSVVRYRQAGGETYEGQVEDGEFGRSHQVTLTNLTPDTPYELEVASTDQAGNAEIISQVASASTTPTVDIIAPKIVNPPRITAADRRAAVHWGTDEIADSEVSYWTGTDPATTVTIGERTTEHLVVLTNLEPSTTYSAVVRSADLQDNGPVEVAGLTFTTTAEADVSAPAIEDNQISALGDVSAKLVWKTDEPSDSFVEFGTSSGLGLVEGSEQKVTEHEVWLTNLEPGIEYHYAVSSTDIAGNDAEEPAATFTTLSSSDADAPVAPADVLCVPGDGSAQVSWIGVADLDVAGYHIYRSGGGETDAVVATLVQDTVYIDVGIENGVEYTYSVRAVDVFSNESDLSTASNGATPDAAMVPTAPQGSVPADGSRAAIQPYLAANLAEPSSTRPDADLEYTFVVARDEAMSNVVATSMAVPEGTTLIGWQVTVELEHDSTYYWAATASDGTFGGRLGIPMSFIADTSIAPIVVGIELASLTTTSVMGGIIMEWSGVEPEDAFVILRSVEINGPSQPISGTLTGEMAYSFIDMRVVGGKTYHYRLQRLFPSGATHLYGPITATAGLPDQFKLIGAAPNPFNPSTVIRFDVPRSERVRLHVYNSLGQQVRTLTDGILEPGRYALTWDGRDESLRDLASGMYFIRMDAPGFVKTQKVTMLR